MFSYRSWSQGQNCHFFGVKHNYQSRSSNLCNTTQNAKVVKVYYFSYINNTGVKSIDDKEIFDAHESLNDFFNGTNISFVYDPCETTFIQSEQLYNGLNGPPSCSYFDEDAHTQGIDIHISQTLNGYSGSASSIGGDELYIGGAVSGEPIYKTSTFAHEMGHCLGLFHTYQGSCGASLFTMDCFGANILLPTDDRIDDTPYDPIILVNQSCQLSSVGCGPFPDESPFPLTNNYMSGINDNCRTNFTPDQIKAMHCHLEGGGSNVLTSDRPDESLFVNTNMTINQDDGYVQITVKQGKTLTITNCTLNFICNIVVENGATLIVDNAVLTSCDDRPFWQGIDVRNGGNVRIKNTSVIEKADIGIETPKTKSHYSIHCDQSTFDNTRNMVLRSSFITDSYVKGCDFYGGETGIELLSVKSAYVKGIPINEYCTFSFMSKEGIISWGSQFEVDHCDFNECFHAISIRNTFGNSTQSSISFNTFTNNSVGVYSNNGDQFIENNGFTHTGDDLGCRYSGLNSFISQGNTFNSGRGEDVYGIGELSSKSERNNYFSDTGIFSWDENSGYAFTKNCFQTLWYDININGNVNSLGQPVGEVFGNQGGEVNSSGQIVSASNCFSPGLHADLTANSVPFVYLLRKVDVFPCLKPESGGTYTFEKMADTDYFGCGSFSPTYVSEFNYIQQLGCDSTRLDSLMKKLKLRINQLTLLETQSTINQTQKTTLSLTRRHLRYAQAQWAWCLRKQNKLTQLYQWYKSLDGKHNAIKAAETLLVIGDKQGAIAELNAIRSTYFGNSLVYDGMEIAINSFDSDSLSSTLNNIEIQKLRQIAALSDPYAAYSRSLLYYLTGEQIEPIGVELGIGPRSKSSFVIETKEVVNISPNPAMTDINIQIENFDPNVEHSYHIKNISGLNLKKGRLIQDNARVDIMDMTNGIYIVDVYTGDSKILTQKLVILR